MTKVNMCSDIRESLLQFLLQNLKKTLFEKSGKIEDILSKNLYKGSLYKKKVFRLKEKKIVEEKY